MEDLFSSNIERLKEVVSRNQDLLSGQLLRKFINLIESAASCVRDDKANFKVLRRVESVFHRLLLELIQSHYNTAEKEKEFRRLMAAKNCAIEDPELMEEIIKILVRLYKANPNGADISFERAVLRKYIEKDLRDNNIKLKHPRDIERTIQTLYRCSCFDIIKRDDSKSELELKADLCDPARLSIHCDEELIKIAQEQQIRLSPESWAYLLHRNLPDVSRMQKILDKFPMSPTVSELNQTLSRTGDKYNLSQYLVEFKETQDLIDEAINSNHVDKKELSDLVEKLIHFERLYDLRQRRNQSEIERVSALDL